MRLLVSVSGPVEAATALAAGADIIDAKDPAAGPLGPVSPDVLRAIARRVAGRRPVTAALGDATCERDIARDAAAFVGAGAGLVKIGFGGIADAHRIEALIAAAARGAGGRVVAVAYADHRRAETATPEAVLAAAIRARAAGILIDTHDKGGPGLIELMSGEAMRQFVTAARSAGLLTALAGRLAAADVTAVRDAGADIVGVRGAACEGGRGGFVSASRIADLLYRLERDAVAANSSAVTMAGMMPGGTARAK